MNTSSSLLLDQRGIATDPATGLIWMTSLVGQGLGGGTIQGSPLKFSWDGATARFGRARHIAATSLDCNWRNQGGELGGGEKKTHFRRKYPLCRETHQNYVFSKKPYEFAGFEDWRLPTVEELWTLAEAGITEDIAGCHSQVWTANSSTKGLLAMIGMSYAAAWMFQHSVGKIDDGSGLGPDAFGDLPQTALHQVRLVRGGAIFQAVF